MNEFFAWVGVIVVGLVLLLIAIPVLTGTVEFWMHWWQIMRRRRRKVDPDP